MNRIRISRNFSLHEFECKDGSHLVKVDEKLIEKLQKLRDRLGVPLYVNSGYRTPEHNQRVGGSRKSQHLLGKAADISIRNIKLPIETVKNLAVSLGFTGIGLYDTFIHLDVRDEPHPRGYSYWDYRKNK